MGKAHTLYKKGLRYFRDIWDLGRKEFLNWEVAIIKFSLIEIYQDLWVMLLEFYGRFHDRMLNQTNTQLTPQEWIGMYRNTEDKLPEWVINAGYLKDFKLGSVQFKAEFMSTFPKPTVGSQYYTLTKVKPITQNAIPPMAFSSWMSRVREDCLTLGSGQTQFNLFFGKLDELFFDPARWWCLAVTFFLAYFAKMGRKWITTQ